MNLGARARTAVVTGSTAGIGLAIATALAAEGASVRRDSGPVGRGITTHVYFGFGA